MTNMNSHPTMFRTVLANVLPIAIAYAILFGLIALANATDARWLLLNGAEVIAAFVGLAIAWRLGGRIAMFLLSGAAVYSAVMFAVHVGVDARAAQGGPVQLAVVGAAFIGVAAGIFLARPSARSVATA